MLCIGECVDGCKAVLSVCMHRSDACAKPYNYILIVCSMQEFLTMKLETPWNIMPAYLCNGTNSHQL